MGCVGKISLNVKNPGWVIHVYILDSFSMVLSSSVHYYYFYIFKASL